MARASSNFHSCCSWPFLGVACRQVLGGPGAPAALRSVLGCALDATAAERAFLVTFPEPVDPAKHRIEACRSVREDGDETPSRSVLRWALSDPAPRIGVDVLDSAHIPEESSVRALGLRQVMSARVPSRSAQTVLVLDGRRVSALPAEDLAELLEAFAGLAGLALAAGAGPDPGPPMRRPETPPTEGTLVGRSAAFRDLLHRAHRVASWRLPVLILGESGSGKEGIARAIHREGPRRQGPFLAVNCSAIPDTLLESELFGAVRGAYTGSDQDRPGLFRLAHGGTLFLDEVGDMPASMQAKLLRVLQEGRVRPVGGRADVAVDVRIVAATHRDLPRLVAEGRFRDDLYWRLAMVDLRVPPLRERLQDIPPLVDHLRARLEADTGGGPVRVSECAMQVLLSHSWPGNVRELEAALARALLRSADGEIRAGHLDIAKGSHPPPSSAAGRPVLERAMIDAALHQEGGNITRAAARIGWSRPKLYRRMAALDVERPCASRSRETGRP